MARLEFTLQTWKVGSACTVYVDMDPEDWAECDDTEKEDYAKDMFFDHVFAQLGDWNWREV